MEFGNWLYHQLHKSSKTHGLEVWSNLMEITSARDEEDKKMLEHKKNQDLSVKKNLKSKYVWQNFFHLPMQTVTILFSSPTSYGERFAINDVYLTGKQWVESVDNSMEL